GGHGGRGQRQPQCREYARVGESASQLGPGCTGQQPGERQDQKGHTDQRGQKEEPGWASGPGPKSTPTTYSRHRCALAGHGCSNAATSRTRVPDSDTTISTQASAGVEARAEESTPIGYSLTAFSASGKSTPSTRPCAASTSVV